MSNTPSDDDKAKKERERFANPEKLDETYGKGLELNRDKVDFSKSKPKGSPVVPPAPSVVTPVTQKASEKAAGIWKWITDNIITPAKAWLSAPERFYNDHNSWWHKPEKRFYNDPNSWYNNPESGWNKNIVTPIKEFSITAAWKEFKQLVGIEKKPAGEKYTSTTSTSTPSTPASKQVASSKPYSPSSRDAAPKMVHGNKGSSTQTQGNVNRLKNMENKSDKMEHEGGKFAELGKKLEKKQKENKWWKF